MDCPRRWLHIVLGLNLGLALGLAQGAAALAQMAGGVSTGKAKPAALDAQHRPITAGGYVNSSDPVFHDVTRAAGLAAWQHRVGGKDRTLISESLGSGVALIDYDGDG